MQPEVLRRRCARPDCARVPAASLTYDYGARAVWIDPAGEPHPSSYDLCARHAGRLRVPYGWQLVDRRSGTLVGER